MINDIVSLIIFSLALIGVFFGAIVTSKSKGKLRVATLMITFASGFFVLYELGGLLSFYSDFTQSVAIYSLNIGVVILLFISLININRIIQDLEGYKPRRHESLKHHKKKKR